MSDKTDDARDAKRNMPAVRNHLLDHAPEEPAPYVVKNTDPYLIDATVEKINDMLGGKGLRAVDRKEGVQSMSAILGLGDEGERFHDLDEDEQRRIMIDALNAPTLPMLNEKVLVGLDLKPAQPAFTGPSGPAFAPMGPGGMGGGMRPNMPQPTPPGGMPPHMPQQQQPGFDPYTGQPLHPSYYPPAAYPTYPPQPYPAQPYPPQGDPQQQGHGYVQPHPYPSYPVPPQPGYGMLPPHGAPPHGPAPYWPPQQPGQAAPHPGHQHAPYPPPPPGHYGYPPQQAAWPPPPIVVDADVDEAGAAAGTETATIKDDDAP